jgi:hypothetical protein
MESGETTRARGDRETTRSGHGAQGVLEEGLRRGRRRHHVGTVKAAGRRALHRACCRRAATDAGTPSRGISDAVAADAVQGGGDAP